MRFRRIASWLGCLYVLGVIGGCGGSDPLGRHAISGAVNLNGAPLEKGNIGFHPVDKSITSSGTVVEGGKYSVPRDKGLPVGKYRVTVNAPKPGTGTEAAKDVMPGDPLPPPQELIPPEWNVNSEQFIEVNDKGPFVFNFDIKPKGK
jgi:hypothetical protein